MEAFGVSQKIEESCLALEDIIKEVEAFVSGKKLSRAKMQHRKALEIATRTLRADGNPVGIIKGLAEGKSAKDEADVIDAEIEWKALLARLEARKAILNGWQSYNRHLSVGVH